MVRKTIPQLHPFSKCIRRIPCIFSLELLLEFLYSVCISKSFSDTPCRTSYDSNMHIHLLFLHPTASISDRQLIHAIHTVKSRELHDEKIILSEKFVIVFRLENWINKKISLW